MHAIGETTSKTNASRLRRRCNQLIALAEKLKLEIKTLPSTTEALSTRSAGADTAADSASYPDILQENSHVNGHYFPPWPGPPSESEFELKPQTAAYTSVPKISLFAQATHILC